VRADVLALEGVEAGDVADETLAVGLLGSVLHVECSLRTGDAPVIGGRQDRIALLRNAEEVEALGSAGHRRE